MTIKLPVAETCPGAFSQFGSGAVPRRGMQGARSPLPAGGIHARPHTRPRAFPIQQPLAWRRPTKK